MIVDGNLIARLETSAAHLGARVADVMVATGVAGSWPAESFCGGSLIALGPRRYINRAVGIGATAVSAGDADVLEAFYRSRNAVPMIEVCSSASRSLIELLAARCYHPAWFRNVYAREPAQTLAVADDSVVTIRQVDDQIFGMWLDVLAAGNGLSSTADRAISDEFATARYAMAEGTNFVAFVDGQPAGCGSLEITGGVGWVGGAATVEEFRGRGVQAALLDHRLRCAAEHGCDLIAASALPTGVSARNLLRGGFSLAFTQLVMTQS